MSRRPSQNRPVPNSSTDQGGGKRRGDFIAVSVVNNRPQISADDFSILQFIGCNLVFAATNRNAATRAKLAEAAPMERPPFYQPRGQTLPMLMEMREVFHERQYKRDS
jgi:hypothetical protein